MGSVPGGDGAQQKAHGGARRGFQILAVLQALADQLQRIRAQGKRVALVSSGAIGAGMGRLGLPRRPSDLRHLQACAAIGQSLLTLTA